jgi:hypothetical protein
MKLTLKVWRQKDAADKGRMVPYELDDVSPDMSFLEMLDVLKEKLILDGEALRDDEHFAYVAAWEYTGHAPVLHRENLEYENVTMVQRSYK